MGMKSAGIGMVEVGVEIIDVVVTVVLVVIEVMVLVHITEPIVDQKKFESLFLKINSLVNVSVTTSIFREAVVIAVKVLVVITRDVTGVGVMIFTLVEQIF